MNLTKFVVEVKMTVVGIKRIKQLIRGRGSVSPETQLGWMQISDQRQSERRLNLRSVLFRVLRASGCPENRNYSFTFTVGCLFLHINISCTGGEHCGPQKNKYDSDSV